MCVPASRNFAFSLMGLNAAANQRSNLDLMKVIICIPIAYNKAPSFTMTLPGWRRSFINIYVYQISIQWILPLGTLNLCIKFCQNPFVSCWRISVRAKVVDWPLTEWKTDIAINWAWAVSITKIQRSEQSPSYDQVKTPKTLCSFSLIPLSIC